MTRTAIIEWIPAALLAPLLAPACASPEPPGASTGAGASELPAEDGLERTAGPEAGGGSACAPGLTACGDRCVDTGSDPAHCGACGSACPDGQACAGGTCTCGSASVSFAASVQPIFDAHCAVAGCHVNTSLDLSVGKARANLVGVPASHCDDGRMRVLPGQPSESYLVDKLRGTDLCSGTRMPKLAALAEDQIQTIADWICAGALDD